MREVIDGKRHYAIDDEKLPSVTTILDATKSAESKAALEKWKARVGENEAERVKNVAATRGTAMHKYLELYIEGKGILDLTEVGQEAESMAKTIIDKGLSDLEEIWGSEVTLYYPGLYAGATDLCGVYMGRESIIDFKQSNKPKNREWDQVQNYFIQGAAYAMAHDYVYKTDIDQMVILMCTPDNYFQRFISNGKEFKEFKSKWLAKICQFYYERNKHET